MGAVVTRLGGCGVFFEVRLNSLGAFEMLSELQIPRGGGDQ